MSEGYSINLGTYQPTDDSIISLSKGMNDINDLRANKQAFQEYVKALRVQVDGPHKSKSSSTVINPLHYYNILIYYNEELVCRSPRRYNDFLWTEKVLEFQFLGRIIPTTPQKNPLTKVGLASTQFNEERRRKLEYFVGCILQLPELNAGDTVFNFVFASRSSFALYQDDIRKSVIDVSEQTADRLMSKLWSFSPFKTS